jgi:putative ABC transport system permease protein
VLAQTVRLALRLLIRNPGFAAIAVITLALGIGATTAMFTIVNGVLFRSLPYHDPERLVVVRAHVRGLESIPALTAAEIEELRAVSLFDGVAVVRGVDASLTSADEMEALPAAAITDDFLEVLGVQPFLGRALSEREDFGPRFVRAVEVSYELWQRRWHGDPSVIGRHIEVNNLDVIIAGIMPKGFSAQLGPGTNVPAKIDIWFPTTIADGGVGRGGSIVVGRLRAGVSVAHAEQAANAVAQRLVNSSPASYHDGQLTLRLTKLQDDLVQNVRPALLALFGAVAFVLLIACANVAQLLVARGANRTRELAVRQALGAGRAEIVRQLFIESLILALLGSIAGLLLAVWGVDALIDLAPRVLPRRDAIGIDVPALGFAVGSGIVCALLFGIAPALHSIRFDLVDTLKAGSLKTPQMWQKRLRSGLTAAEVALSLVLLVGAGLMFRTFVALNGVPLGFRSDGILTVNVPLNFRAFADRDARVRFYSQALERVRSIPGVNTAALIFPLPVHGPASSQYYGLESDAGSTDRVASTYAASPGYLQTMRIRLISGRDFTWDDIARDHAVIIVDERFARESWPNQNPVGQRVLLQINATVTRWTEVIGMTGHVHEDGLKSSGLGQIYRPCQMFTGNMDVVARVGDNPIRYGAAIKGAIESLGPGRPVREMHTMNALVDDVTADTRFALVTLAIFALVALLLAGVGLYGVIAYASAARVRELGIRIALGARPSEIARLVIADGAICALGGVAIGTLGAAVLTRWIDTLLFGVTATDPLTFAAGALLMMLVAVGASYSPARRASRVDPMVALRVE